MHHKFKQSRGFASEILCLRIKDINLLSQILKLIRKEVLPPRRSQICKNLLSSELAEERLFFSILLDICSSHTFLWWQLNMLRGFLMKTLFLS